MKHLENCNFEQIIDYLEGWSWNIGEAGEEHVSFDLERIEYYATYCHTIEFNYCPVCGVQLK